MAGNQNFLEEARRAAAAEQRQFALLLIGFELVDSWFKPSAQPARPAAPNHVAKEEEVAQ